jgi:hypothetical protein
MESLLLGQVEVGNPKERVAWNIRIGAVVVVVVVVCRRLEIPC